MKFWRITTFGIIFTAIILVWIFIFGFSADKKGSYYNDSHNAAWISSSWIENKKNDAEILSFVQELKLRNIETIFIPINKNYDFALDFMDKSRGIDKNFKFISSFEMKDNISIEEWSGVLKQIMILNSMVGFDGVNLKIGQIETDYLDQIKKKFPEKLLYLTLSKIRQENLKNLVDASDYLIIAPKPINSDWWYRFKVKENLIKALNMVKNEQIFVLLDTKDSEKFEAVLLGVIDGLNNFRSNERNFSGVAIGDFESITAKEKNLYETFWQK